MVKYDFDLDRIIKEDFYPQTNLYFINVSKTDYLNDKDYINKTYDTIKDDFEYNGKIENHELKASLTAFMGSISISNFKNGKIDFATDTHNDLLKEIDMVEFTKGYKKRIDFINKGIEKLNLKRPNKPYALLDYDITSGKPQNIPYELYS